MQRCSTLLLSFVFFGAINTDVLEASEHQPKYEFSVTGKKRIKSGTRTVTIGTMQLCKECTLMMCTLCGRLRSHGANVNVSVRLWLSTGTKVEINGKDVAIFKNYGQFYAIDNTCPHQGASLHLGDIEDIDGMVCVSCPRHHWPFSLEDGSCLVPVKIQAQWHPVQVRTMRDGSTRLFVGFPALTDTLFSDDDF